MHRYPHKAHCFRARNFYLRRNSNISAQAGTGKHSVRCTVTSLILKWICSRSFLTMQHDLCNKASIFELHFACCTLPEWYCKTQGIQRFFYLEISKKLPCSDIPSFTDKQFCILRFICSKLKCPNSAVLFIKPFKVRQFKRSLTRDFELVVM